MTAHHGYSSYSTNTARYASAGIQVAMLLATVGRHMEAAREAIKSNDFEGRFNATEKAATIISGLRGCLDHSTPEISEVSNTLDAYYANLLTYLTQINIKNDLTLCESVIESVRIMSTTWREVQARADEEARATLTTPAAPAVATGTGTSGSDVSA